MPEEDAPSSIQEPIAVLPWVRAASAVLGLAGLGAGVAAVFVTESEVGSVAPLVVGAGFVLLGLVGYLPTRLRWEGRGEVQWQREVGIAVATIVDKVPGGSRPDILSALDDISRFAPAVGAAPLRAYARDQSLRDSLYRVAVPGVDMTFDALIAGERFDAVASNTKGERVLIDLKGFGLRGKDARMLVASYQKVLQASGARKIVLVTSVVPSALAMVELGKLAEVDQVSISDPDEGVMELEAVLHRSLAGAE